MQPLLHENKHTLKLAFPIIVSHLGQMLLGLTDTVMIGRVGTGDAPFLIGDDSGGLRVRGSGTLFLGVNDDYLADNTGSFRVVVYY